jgi:hypothetical protein
MQRTARQSALGPSSSNPRTDASLSSSGPGRLVPPLTPLRPLMMDKTSVLYTILFQADTNTNGVWHLLGAPAGIHLQRPISLPLLKIYNLLSKG